MESKLNTMPTYVILHKNDDTEREEEVDVLQICGQAEWAPKEILGDIYCRFFSYDKIKNIALSRTTEY